MIEQYLRGDHELFRSEDGRWVVTRSHKTGSFRLHDTLHNSQLFIGNMPDLRFLAELAALVYEDAHERFKNDLVSLAGGLVFVPDEDIPY